jgi:hypothetical protein
MKTRGVLAIILITCWFGVVPAAAHDCCHHGNHCADCGEYNGDCCQKGQGGSHCHGWAPSSGVVDLQTSEGKITEVVYLPGATPDSSMVEVHLQSAGQSQLVRLAPVGFLKQSGLLLREGDTITVKGFPVAGMEGDLLVATELHKGEKTLSLRDTRGRPAW